MLVNGRLLIHWPCLYFCSILLEFIYLLRDFVKLFLVYSFEYIAQCLLEGLVLHALRAPFDPDPIQLSELLLLEWHGEVLAQLDVVPVSELDALLAYLVEGHLVALHHVLLRVEIEYVT